MAHYIAFCHSRDNSLLSITGIIATLEQQLECAGVQKPLEFFILSNDGLQLAVGDENDAKPQHGITIKQFTANIISNTFAL